MKGLLNYSFWTTHFVVVLIYSKVLISSLQTSIGKSHYFIKTLFMQPKLLGFRVSQHQQTRFSDITEEIEIATMFKDLTSWYCNFLSNSDEIFKPFFLWKYELIVQSIFWYKNIVFKLMVHTPLLWKFHYLAFWKQKCMTIFCHFWDIFALFPSFQIVAFPTNKGFLSKSTWI